MTDLQSLDRSARRSRRTTVKTVGAAVLAASLLGAFATGCTSNSSSTSSTAAASSSPPSPPPSQLPDGAQLISESAKTTQTLHSVHLDIKVSNLQNLPVDTISADVTNQPSGQAIGEASIRLKEGDPFTKTKFLAVDKKIYVSSDGTKYVPVGDTQKVYDPGVILDKEKGIANVIAHVKGAKAVKRETVNGVNTVQVTGTIDPTVIDPIVPKIGDKVTGTLPITLWITDTTPPKSATDATTLPSTAASPGTGPNLVQAQVDKDKGNATIDLSNWAKPVTVTKPAG
ncbi:LppX_LprAFG lipoprotein [Nocardia macrotermitis]|uniref:Putative diacylated glycolipid transporter LprF n=1 Tax=Nocardia macrotermitis TaxID=2585198 RepID=A0A7K0D1M6_9NOCA|nr:LppX_LprAFG lipoprotein [Nocardia macrotermitis]MQY19597.1 putative diacylated glycolipid transporter LprF [Nocardia macrotermitis]